MQHITPRAIITADSITTNTVFGIKKEMRTPSPNAKTPIPTALAQNLDFIEQPPEFEFVTYDKYMYFSEKGYCKMLL